VEDVSAIMTVIEFNHFKGYQMLHGSVVLGGCVLVMLLVDVPVHYRKVVMPRLRHDWTTVWKM